MQDSNTRQYLDSQRILSRKEAEVDIQILLIGLTSTQIIITIDMKATIALVTKGTKDIITKRLTITTRDIITTNTRITSPALMPNSQCFEKLSRV